MMMKIKTFYVGAVLLLMTGFCVLPEAKSQTTSPMQANQQEALLHQDEGAKGDYWLLLPDKRGIYYNEGRVGIGTANPSEKLMLHVAGTVGVNELMIGSEYALPAKRGTADQFLNGLGEWATPFGGVSGGDNYWQPVGLNNAIYYNLGWVGIGTDNPAASLHVQGNMKMGSNIGAVGTNAFAGGEENQASGQSAFSYGKLNQASGPFSIALGRESKALDHAAIALGYHAEAKVGNTIAIGKFVESTSSSAITIGTGTGTGSNMLRNNFSHSFMLGFYSNVPTFFVGSSNGAGTTGKIGIGNMTAPQAKLHMLSDEDEAATLKLEHRTTGTKRYAEISLGTHRIRAGNTENMVFSTPDANRDFVFENGNVGIGTSDPTSILHIHQNEEPVLKLANVHGNLIMAIVNTPSHFAPTSQAGDVVFKTNYDGSHHGIIFNMNDEFNDGNSYIRFNDNRNHNTLTIFNNGRVGIGTVKPEVKLHIDGDIRISDLANEKISALNRVTLADRKGGLLTSESLLINSRGAIGIGLSQADYTDFENSWHNNKLYVNGGVMATELWVKMTSDWSDFVFEKDYNLKPLTEVEDFITTHGHLPEIPSADEVAELGINLGKMDAKLLQKIEELMLYTIEQQKQIDELRKQLNDKNHEDY
ncbi:MAG: hypothetical protein PF694_14390 [Bacteroidetes bacterium]|nr:hypothetical protein [Bacteroidota bacterium]